MHPPGHGTPALARARALVCLLPLLLFPPHALGAQAKPRVQLDALVGFNGLAREGRFAPVLVSVATPGTRLTAEVRVDVVWGSSLRGTQESRRFVRSDTFAAGGVRRLPFVVPLPPEARTLAVTVVSGGETIAHTQVDLRAVATPDRLVAAVSSTLSLDALAGLSDASGAVRVVYPRVDDLPDAWGGYDGLDMVVVHDTYFRQLRDAQVAALERWIVTGGVVVFTGGAAGLQHEGAGFGRLLPVDVTGLGELAAMPALAALVGEPAGPRGRISVAEASVTTGTVLAEQGGQPLLVRRGLGRGTIWFLAVDPTLPPFTSWPGTLALWQLMDGRDRRPGLAPSSRGPADDPWMSVLLSAPPLAFPPLLVVLAFCGGYVGLLAAAIAGGGRLRIGPRLRAFLLAAVPLAACAAGWVLFDIALYRPGPVLLDASVAEVRSGQDLAWVSEKVGLFASRPGVSGLAFDSPDVLLDELVPFAGLPRKAWQSDSPLTVAAGPGAVVRDMTMGRYGSRLIAAGGVVRFPVSIAFDGNALSPRLTVANASEVMLRSAFLWRKGRAWPVGDVPPGSTRSIPVVPDAGQDPRAPGVLKSINGTDRRASFWSLVSAEAGSGQGVLAAWLDEPALPFSVTGARRAADRPTLSLLLVEAP